MTAISPGDAELLGGVALDRPLIAILWSATQTWATALAGWSTTTDSYGAGKMYRYPVWTVYGMFATIRVPGK
jgi:hypothetical protein